MLAFLFLWRGHIAVQCRVYVYEKGRADDGE